MRNRRIVVLALTFFLAGGGLARADGVLKVLEDIEIHGFVSSSYTFNFNEPTRQAPNSATNINRIFDKDHNSFKFDVAELVLLKETPNRGDVGFRTDLNYGFSIPEVTQSTPGPGDTQNSEFDLQQGYVSWNAPVGKGLQLDFGKFITHVGAEVIEGYDGWNYNFSRSFLFGLAIPFTHTGLRAGYEINDKVSVMGMIANGWDNTTDNNSGKTFGTQIAYTPNSNIGLLLNWVVGPESANSNDLQQVFDVVLDIGITDDTLLQLNFDYGITDNADADGSNAEWWGVAGIVRHDYNKWFSINLRGEYFDDVDGTRAGSGGGAPAGQQLWEITVTPEFRINQNLIVRLEYRHDQSTADVFFDENPGTFTDSQDTVAVNGIFYF